MNNEMQLKVKIINDYMSLVNLNDTNNIDYTKIETELALALNERPAVTPKYHNETVMNEDGSGEKRISKLESIEIFYSYMDGEQLRSGKLNFIIA